MADTIRKDYFIFLPPNLSTFQHLQPQNLLFFLLQWMNFPCSSLLDHSLLLSLTYSRILLLSLLSLLQIISCLTSIICFCSPGLYLRSIQTCREICHLTNTLPRCHIIYCSSSIIIPFLFSPIRNSSKYGVYLPCLLPSLPPIPFFLRHIVKYFRCIKRISEIYNKHHSNSGLMLHVSTWINICKKNYEKRKSFKGTHNLCKTCRYSK